MKLTEQIKKLEGLTIHTIHTDKYKTNTFLLMIKAPLEKETVAYRALLSQIFQNGTINSPTRLKLRERLEDMYGATLSTDVQKKGEHHIITSRLDVANEQFLSEPEPLFEKGLTLLAEVLLQPQMTDGVFEKTVIENEKRSLIQRIESLYDDKMRYANMRIIEEMCKDEPYALTSFGTVDAVKAITPASLSEYYAQLLQDNQFDLYMIGALEEAIAVTKATEVFDSLTTDRIEQRTPVVHTQKVKKEKVIQEIQDIKQGKLHIGFRTYTTFADEDYVAMQVFNGLFGGFSHSKLFINVREKESLAYYASSQLESHKGIIIVMSGIEFSKYDRALEIIKEQFEAMKNGDFTDEEVNQTKAMLKNQLLETVDGPRGLAELSYHQVVSGHARTINEWVDQIDHITKEDITRVANKVELDTIYFLTGKEENV